MFNDIHSDLLYKKSGSPLDASREDFQGRIGLDFLVDYCKHIFDQTL